MQTKPKLLPTHTPRLFQNEDIWRPVEYKGQKVPFALAKMDQWKHDKRLWAIEQVFTKDESDQRIKGFPDLQYFWEILDLWEKYRILLVPKTRRMMMTHLLLSLDYAHTLLFMPNSYNGIISLMEVTATTHLRDRTLFTLEHLDYNFPYPELSWSKKQGIHVTKESLINYEIGSSIHAFASGSNKFRGMTMTKALFDEWAHQPNQKENWTATIPALEGRNTYGVFISSVEPDTYMQEVCEDVDKDAPYEVVMDGLSYQLNNKKACILHVNYRADPRKNPDTPEGKEWYDRERSKYDDYIWFKEYEGKWRFPTHSRVYYEFDKASHCKDWETFGQWNKKTPLLIGFDPGTNYPCVVIGYHNFYGHFVVHQAFLFRNVLMPYVVKFVKEYLMKEFGTDCLGKDIWYCDPAIKAKSGQGTALAGDKVLKTLLGHNRVKFKSTLIKHRVDQFQRMLADMLVKINPNCGTVVDKSTHNTKERHGVFIDMLEWGYQRKKIKDKKADQDTEPEKDGFWDHFSDALGAILAVIYQKDIEEHKTSVKRNKSNKPTDPWFAETVKTRKTSNSKSKYKKISRPYL
jgi:hypothetical protein